MQICKRYSCIPFRFSTNIIFSFLVPFTFFVFLFFVETKKIYIPIHIRLWSRMSEKKITHLISGNKSTFSFWTSLIKNFLENIFKESNHALSLNIKFFSAYFSLIKNLFIFIENTQFWIRFIAGNCCQWLVWFPYIFC